MGKTVWVSVLARKGRSIRNKHTAGLNTDCNFNVNCPKVMKREGNKYDVRYFGSNYERGHIDAKNIQPIETPITKLKVRRNAQWNEAYEELQKFQEIAKNPSLVNELPTKKTGKKGKSEYIFLIWT